MKGATDYMIKKQHITIKKETEDENVIKKSLPPQTQWLGIKLLEQKETGRK